MSSHKPKSASILALCIAGCWTPALQAQTDSGSIGLEEIVVTAQKRAENLQEVPIAVSAFTAQRLETAGIKDVLQLNALTPSANASTALGFVKPFIRGAGSTANGAGVESAVSIYVDGVYIASTPASLFSFNDVARIEVLKGPQGTLFGRNSVGGLIQIITADPTEKLSGKLEGTYGSYKTWKLGGTLSGPIASRVGFTLAAQYEGQGNGYGTNYFDYSDANYVQHDFSVRGKLAFDFDATKIKLSADHTSRNSPLFYFRPVAGFGKESLVPSSRVWDANNNQPNIMNLLADGTSLRIEHEFSAVNFLSISAYRRSNFNYAFDPDVSPLPISAVNTLLRQRQITQELQLQSKPGSAFDWTTGVFYYSAREYVDPNRTILTPTQFVPRFIDNFAKLGSESTAVFGQASFPIAADTKLTTGVRYTKEKRDVSSRRVVTLGSGFVPPATINPSQNTSFSKWTWRLALDHKFTPDMLGYASYSRGFKSGGFIQNFPTDPAFRPETIDAYEIGLKNELFDRRVRLNLAAYWNDYKDRQINIAPPPPAATTTILNAGASRSRGVEAELEAAVSEQLTVSSGIGLMDSKFTRFDPPANPASTNCTLFTPPSTTVSSRCNLAGKRTPNSPRVTFNAGANWHQDVSFGQLLAGFNYSYNSGFFFEGDNLLKQKAYNKLSAQIGWKSPSDTYSVKLWGNNLLNAEIMTLGTGSSTGTASTYEPPRTYGVTLGAKF